MLTRESDDLAKCFGIGRGIQCQRPIGQRWVRDAELGLGRPLQNRGILFQIGRSEASWNLLRLIEAHEQEDTAAASPFRDTDQSPHRDVGKIRGKIGHDEHAVRLGNLARKFIVFVDCREFVPQIGLQDRFHVLGQIGQTLLNLRRFGPDPA